ncbi:pyridoxal phosphate-dependent transferase [Apiospora arundinis]|uniref:Uncharacterized protein n=1 Tax=Apiospora arundinis TaxID=335852 RepID=A0ABR2HY28_9PEZI
MTAQDPQSFTRKCALQGSKGLQTADNNLLPMPVTPTREREVTFQSMCPQSPASDEPWNPIGRENRMIEPETPPRLLTIPSGFLNSTVYRLLCEVNAQWATKHPFIDYYTARGADLVMVLNEGAGGVMARRIARLAYL